MSRINLLKNKNIMPLDIQGRLFITLKSFSQLLYYLCKLY